VLERWGVEGPATNRVTDDPMPKGKGAGPRPYVLYHKRWSIIPRDEDPRRPLIASSIEFCPERDMAVLCGYNIAGNDWNAYALVESR